MIPSLPRATANRMLRVEQETGQMSAFYDSLTKRGQWGPNLPGLTLT